MARDADAPLRPRSEVKASLTAELVFAATLVASGREGPSPDWVARQTSQMDEAALAFVPRVAGLWWPTMGVIDYLCHSGAYDDPAGYLRYVASVPIEDFLEVLFNGDLSRDQVRRYLSQPQAAAELGPDLCQFSSGPPELFVRIFSDAEGHRDGLLALIRAADTPFFRETWTKWQRDARPWVTAVETALVGQDPLTVAENLRQKPISGPRNFERVVFVPSRLMAHRHIRCWGAGVYLFFLQEGAISVLGTNQTGNELAEFLKVLGDKTRMDILRLLSAKPSYGKEIAASLNLTTATVSRHLDQLKSAGLVQEDRADAHNVKRLNYVPQSLEAQWERLKTYLLHS